MREGRQQLPSVAQKEVLAALLAQERQGLLRGAVPVHDGRKSLFTARQLPMAGDEGSCLVANSEGREYNVSLKLVRSFRLAEMLAGDDNTQKEAIMALDVVMRQRPTDEYVQSGRSFFSPLNKAPLVPGYEVWHGHHQSLRRCQAGMLLNFDMTATAFVEEGHVLTFASKVLGLRPEQFADPRGLPDYMRQVRETKPPSVKNASSGDRTENGGQDPCAVPDRLLTRAPCVCRSCCTSSARSRSRSCTAEPSAASSASSESPGCPRAS